MEKLTRPFLACMFSRFLPFFFLSFSFLNSFIFGKSPLRHAPPQLGVKQQLLGSGVEKATSENKIKPES